MLNRLHVEPKDARILLGGLFRFGLLAGSRRVLAGLLPMHCTLEPCLLLLYPVDDVALLRRFLLQQLPQL